MMRSKRALFLIATGVLAILFPGGDLSAQRNLTNIPDPSPEAQRRTFQVADGFAVNLYASDPLVTKPIQIAFDDAAKWADHVSGKLRRQLNDPDLPLEMRMELLLEASRSMMREVFDNPLAPGIRRKVEHLGDAVAKVMSEPGAFASAVRLMEHDYSTSTHSFHVSIFAVALARAAGCRDENYLTSLGRGGLMHDVGKTLVPARILNKPGRLNEEEFAAIRHHPSHGEMILRKLQWRDPVVRDVVLSHHERVDGSGYPRGLRGEAVSLAARIAALADAFDAMTTDRSYCAAKTPVAALRALRSSGAGGYDPPRYTVFVRRLPDPCAQPAPRSIAPRPHPPPPR